jgi:alkylhydroperoxidase/carboxymuconolactone decarboxylase family protein YurZ
MKKIELFLIPVTDKKEFIELSLALLSASAVLRKEKELREILYFLKKKKFNKRKIYEALLQTYLFAGYPSALISLTIYSEFFNNENQIFEQWNISVFKKRGEKNCRKIYGNKFNKLISNVKSFSPDLSDWLVTEGYGKVLGRKGLSLRERETCNIAVLSALKFESQLYSHINGGHRLGLKWNEINKIIISLSVLGKKDCVRFGLKVLNSFKKRKEENEILPSI